MWRWAIRSPAWVIGVVACAVPVSLGFIDLWSLRDRSGYIFMILAVPYALLIAIRVASRRRKTRPPLTVDERVAAFDGVLSGELPKNARSRESAFRMATRWAKQARFTIGSIVAITVIIAPLVVGAAVWDQQVLPLAVIGTVMAVLVVRRQFLLQRGAHRLLAARTSETRVDDTDLIAP